MSDVHEYPHPRATCQCAREQLQADRRLAEGLRRDYERQEREAADEVMRLGFAAAALAMKVLTEHFDEQLKRMALEPRRNGPRGAA